MAQTKKSLADTMSGFDNGRVATEETAKPEAAKRPPSRRDKRAITGYVSGKAFQQFQILRAERGKDVQEMMEEAINDMFKKYGKPPIA